MPEYSLQRQRELDREVRDARIELRSVQAVYYTGWGGGALGLTMLLGSFVLPLMLDVAGEAMVILGFVAVIMIVGAAAIVDTNREKYVDAQREYHAARDAVEDYQDTAVNG
jgi:hypothetical protein